MSIYNKGDENNAPKEAQSFIEMEPRVWYPVEACSIVENQFPRPLLVADKDPALYPWPNNVVYDPENNYRDTFLDPIDHEVPWPSPHFHEELTAFTILAGEKRAFGSAGFIMSTHYRLQPISNNLLAELPTCSEVAAQEEAENPPPPTKQNISFFTNILLPGTYTEADLASGSDVLSFMITAELEEAEGTLQGKGGTPIPIACGEAKGQSEIVVDPRTKEYCPVSGITIEVTGGQFEVIGQCLN